MSTLADLVVGLSVDTGDFSKGLDSAAQSASSFGGIATAAMGVAAVGVTALGGALVAAVGNASEAQDVMAQTQAVIKATGGAAGMSAQQMGDLASSLSSASGLSKYGDEAILTGENMLATFTNIGASVFPHATKTALDMAQAFHSTPEAMTMMIGKALNSADAMGALKRQGVAFTDAQLKLGKQLFDTGHVIEYQNLVLGELDKEFGGSAAAAANTFSGKIGTLKDKFGELLEGVGTKLLPTLSSFIDILNSPAAQEGIQAIADAIVNGLGAAATWFSTTGLAILQGAWIVLTALFAGNLAPLQAVITDFGAYLSTNLPLWGEALIGWIMPYIPIALDNLNNFIVGIGEWALAQVPIIQAYVLTWGNAFVDWISPYIPIALAMLATFITDVGAWIVAQDTVILAQVLTWGQAFIAWIAPYIPIALAQLGGLVASVGAWIMTQGPVIQAQLMAWGVALMAWIAPYVPIVLGALATFGQSVLTWITTEATTLYTAFIAWGQSFIAWIPGATADFLKAWPGMLNSFLDWIGSAAGPIIKQLLTWGAAFVAWVIPMIPPFLVALAGIILAMVTWIGETAVTLGIKLLVWAKAFEDWVKTDVAPKFPGWLNDINTQMWAWADTFKGMILTKLEAVGKAIVDGIKAGVSGAWSALTSFVTQKATELLNSAKNALGIHSPSKEFADQVGSPIILGIIQGMQTTFPQMLSYIGNAGRQILAKTLDVYAQFTRSSGLDVFKALLDIQKVPTFQPLIDSTKAYQQAQENAADTAQKLKDVQTQIALAESTQSSVDNNQELTKLYQEQADLLKQQADQKKAIWDTGLAVNAAQATSNEQANAINTIASEAREAYEAAQKQALSLMSTDAAGALDFFNKRKAQIQELADLEKQRALATTDQERADLDTQIALTKAAQAAEQAQQAVQINIGQQDTHAMGNVDIVKIIQDALNRAGIQVDIRTRTG